MPDEFNARPAFGPRSAPAPSRAPGGLPALRSVRLLDRLRERIRYLHYSRRTEDAYVHWVRAFVRFHGLRHPSELGGPEVEAFLSWLVNDRSVAAATHRQALSALLFLYGKVLGTDLPWMIEIGRPKAPRRLPVVLGRDEVAATLAQLEGEHRLLAQLLVGTGMRITEALQLRVKDVEFAHGVVVVRQGKGSKDRVVMLPGRWCRRCATSCATRSCCGRPIRPKAAACAARSTPCPSVRRPDRPR